MKEIQTSRELLAKLKATLIRQRSVRFAAGLLTTLAVLGLIWLILTLTANLFVLPVWFKLTLVGLAGALALYIFGRYAISRLAAGDIDSVAVALEEQNQGLKGRLIAAVEFARSVRPEGFSPDLVALTEKQALGQTGQIDFGRVVSLHPLLRTGRRAVFSWLMVAILFVAAPGLFSRAVEVYSQPTSRIAPAIAYELVTVPGSTEWVKYRDITFGGALVGLRLPKQAAIYHRLVGGSWQKTELDLESLTPAISIAGDSVTFGLTFRRVDRSFDFYVEAGELKSEVERIDVVDRPRVTGMALSLFYPAYTDLSPLTIDENNGSFSAVVGTRVNLAVVTNLPVEKADLVWEDGSRTPLSVDGKKAEASLVVGESKGYHLELRDHLGEANPDPIEYYITAVPDEYPTVDVIRPGFDVNLNDEMLLPLKVRIYDDYGFTSLVMKYRVISRGRPSEETVAVLHFSDRIKSQGEVEFNWDLDRLNLYPGDFVTYFFEVADNDQISGPKVGSSRTFLARLPSLDEIISQTEQDTRQRVINVEEMVRSGKELARRMKEAARKLEAQNPEGQKVDWQQQQEMEAIAQQNQEMTSKIEQTAEQMEEALKQMEENSLMSREIMEKLAEIQKLFEEVATPEMRAAQERLKKAMEEMDRLEMQKAMEDFEMSQEELLERLERTLALLKQMEVEAKMEAMIRKAEELLERQDKVNSDAEKSEQEALSELSPEEKKLSAGLDELKKEAEQLKKMLAPAGMDDVPEAQQFAEAVAKTDADQNMEQMAQALSQQQKSKAQDQGQKASSKLSSMLGKMQEMQMAMSEGGSEEMERQLRKAIKHANSLSDDQEGLLREAQTIVPNSVVVRDMAASQQDLSKAVSGLRQTISELGKESPFIAAELQGLLNVTVANMDLAAREFEAKKGHTGVRFQRQAMTDLNRASLRLMESLEQQQQCENGSSCDKGMASLESLGKRQQRLNQATQGMCNNPGQGSQARPGAEGQKMRAGMKRLAGEQGAIRKSLEQLEQEFGGSRQILGRLSDIIDEMKQVEESLASGQAGPETADRQLKIYSRMLQATRSLQRKDFTDRRQAASALDQPVYLPPTLPASLFDESVDLEDRLRSFLGDSYPPQYEAQIKAYFRALLKANIQ